jgi:hypothetical protein
VDNPQALDDMMHLQNVMVDHSLDKIEKPPTEDHPSEEHSARPWHVASSPDSEQHPQACRCREPRTRVKYTVPEHVNFGID